jgi:hypothetical protein
LCCGLLCELCLILVSFAVGKFARDSRFPGSSGSFGSLHAYSLAGLFADTGIESDKGDAALLCAWLRR